LKIIFFTLFISLYLYASDTIQPLTETWTPYQMETNDGLTGISVDLIKEIQKRIGNNKEIQLTTWNRAYDVTLNQLGYALFLTTRSDKREKLFKWVGPTTSMKLVFFKNKKRTDLQILTLDDAKKVNSIVVAKQTIATEKLKEYGFKNLEINTLSNYSFAKLRENKIDLYPVEYHAFMYKLKNLHLEDQIVPVKMKKPIYEAKLYIAFNINTDEKIIKTWQNALDDIKKDGTYDKILNRYK
jgi:polar amino acid transport system substrate-binding protein